MPNLNDASQLRRAVREFLRFNPGCYESVNPALCWEKIKADFGVEPRQDFDFVLEVARQGYDVRRSSAGQFILMRIDQTPGRG